MLRSERFVTQKIIQAVKKIELGIQEKLHLGNLDIYRDWGWSKEYVQAMHLMLEQQRPDDYIVATGKMYSLKQFVEASLDYVGLNYQDYLIQDEALMKDSELQFSSIDPS